MISTAPGFALILAAVQALAKADPVVMDEARHAARMLYLRPDMAAWAVDANWGRFERAFAAAMEDA